MRSIKNIVNLALNFFQSLNKNFVFVFFRYSPTILKVSMFAYLDFSGKQIETGIFGMLLAKLFFITGLSNLGVTSFVQSKEDYVNKRYSYTGSLILFTLLNFLIIIIIGIFFGFEITPIWVLVIVSELLVGEAFSFVLYFKNSLISSMVYFFKNIFVLLIFISLLDFQVSIIFTNILVIFICFSVGFRIRFNLGIAVFYGFYKSVKYTIHGYIFSKSFEFIVRNIFISEIIVQNFLNYLNIVNNFFYSLYDNYILNKNYKLILTREYSLVFFQLLSSYGIFVILYLILYIFVCFVFFDWKLIVFISNIFLQIGFHIYFSNCILYRKIPYIFLFSLGAILLFNEYLELNAFVGCATIFIYLLLIMFKLNMNFVYKLSNPKGISD